MSMLTVASSPHIKHVDSTKSIMLDVLIALSPAAIGGIVLFGLKALSVIVTCVLSSVLLEWICCKILKKPNTCGDLSAAVTGLLIAMNLPATIPLWMAVIGCIVAIVVVKQLFGGIGHNFVNPAITARIVLTVSFASAMTNWIRPLSIDAVTTATPLSSSGIEVDKVELLLGLRGGCIGETSSVLLILGGLYLIIRRVISPAIPLSFILTTVVLCTAFGYDPIVSLLSGGLLLGAIFMATDYVTSPTSTLGKIVFGIGCGAITAVIRKFGALPEGVSFAIILMNILVPHINTLTMRKPFGFSKGDK